MALEMLFFGIALAVLYLLQQWLGKLMAYYSPYLQSYILFLLGVYLQRIFVNFFAFVSIKVFFETFKVRISNLDSF